MAELSLLLQDLLEESLLFAESSLLVSSVYSAGVFSLTLKCTGRVVLVIGRHSMPSFWMPSIMLGKAFTVFSLPYVSCINKITSLRELMDTSCTAYCASCDAE